MQQHDILRRFVFEVAGVRGEWVRLEQSWLAAKQHQSSNAPTQHLLGEALAAVVLLSATIKFKGSLILQAQGNGELKTLVVQATHDRRIRGLIKGNIQNTDTSIAELFGEGYMVLTIKSETAEPYQGIVSLTGHSIADALQQYFDQSEQLRTRLWLFADEHHAAGLLLQQLPDQVTMQEDWSRIEMLANTLTRPELMNLSCEDFLYRLFHEEKVTVFSPEPVSFACTCSTQKIEATLHGLGADELRSIIAERNQIDVHCEFCGRHYCFDSIDIERIIVTEVILNEHPDTRH